MSGRSVKHYAIYKKMIGVPWPGLYWEGCKSDRQALRRWKDSYFDTATDGKVFHIVCEERTVVWPRKPTPRARRKRSK